MTQQQLYVDRAEPGGLAVIRTVYEVFLPPGRQDQHHGGACRQRGRDRNLKFHCIRPRFTFYVRGRP